ncbi:MAG: putative conserved small protein [Pseudomonas sp.]|uniref:DUF1127 domain-containing protein n=1 Tax=Pseudomonas sp. TaxID=306 RepID=UPI00263518C3|nr:DUF1127 domain-containing protein [Pseudomonas sp.]MDB6050892.1 putative conserved small protein [Pseudomonas sp.]
MERTISSDLFFETTAANEKAVWPLRAFANLMLWQRRISSRHQLARLDARLLADAGISESQRYEELSKPFWR